MKNRDVAVLILHNKNKILLQKRSQTAKRFPSKWGLFGGGLEEGENPEIGVKREIQEELGILIKVGKRIAIYPYILDCTKEKGNIYVFESKYNGSELNLMEGESMKWVKIEEALKLDIPPHYKNIIEDIEKNHDFMVL